jgi:hypothetical protein
MKWLVWNGGDKEKSGRPPLLEVLGIIETDNDDPIDALLAAINTFKDVEPHPIVEPLGHAINSINP